MAHDPAKSVVAEVARQVSGAGSAVDSRNVWDISPVYVVNQSFMRDALHNRTSYTLPEPLF